MKESVGIFEQVRRSPLMRILFIGFLILLLQIPISMIEELIWERQRTDQEAIAEVSGKWGHGQVLAGPVLMVPFNRHEPHLQKDGQTILRTRQERAMFLPALLDVDGELQTELRYRGIFEVPVYRMGLTVKGRFQKPDFASWDVAPEDVLWDRAQLWVEISDARAIQEPTSLRWNGTQIPFAAGTGEGGAGESGIHVPLSGHMQAEAFEFSFPLVLNGSLRAYAAPVGDFSTIRLHSDWTDPSFQGAWLPTTREVSAGGFEAQWKISSLGRNYPQRWLAGTQEAGRLRNSAVGVELVSPVDNYRMAQRSVKYEVLFLVLTFLALWLFEVRSGLRIHSVQYLLVGAAMCLFYLLELSLSEHLGFVLAYGIASGAVVALVTSYCIAVLRGFGRAAVIGAVMALLYGYLYVLLVNQDYALLAGSIGLFVVLGAVMALTQRIDWSAGGTRSAAVEAR